MAGHKPFRKLIEPILADPDRRAAFEASRREAEAELALANVRRARGMTQTQLAEAMDKPQTAISRIERQADLYVSTLRRYVEAMGGQLEVRAVFPDAVVQIARFGGLDEPAEAGATADRLAGDGQEPAGRAAQAR